jgi:hypothetical protein
MILSFNGAGYETPDKIFLSYQGKNNDDRHTGDKGSRQRSAVGDLVKILQPHKAYRQSIHGFLVKVNKGSHEVVPAGHEIQDPEYPQAGNA